MQENEERKPAYISEQNLDLVGDPSLGVGVPAAVDTLGLWDTGPVTNIYMKIGHKHTDWQLITSWPSVIPVEDAREITIEKLTQKHSRGAPNGLATLGPDGILTPSQRPPSGGGSSSPVRWWDIKPIDGKVLPLSQPRAYYTVVLFNSVAIFNDGTNLRKYVAYYGAGASAQAYAAFSDDGITWDNETIVTGLVGLGYHASVILVSGTIHYFYWDTVGSIYRPESSRHATFDPSISCVAALTDAPCTGNYITGISGNLRYGTYGIDQVFYNATPTNNPLNPFSYQWCAIHNGTDGSNEGILFATSNDGFNFSAWNGLTEVIPRGLDWDKWIGRISVWQDSLGLFHAFYSGGLGTGAGGEDSNFAGAIGYATSLNGITWVKHDKNPILRKTEFFKSWKRCYCPWVIKDGTDYKMYYTCKNNAGNYITSYALVNGAI